jgi:hypothetical protein
MTATLTSTLNRPDAQAHLAAATPPAVDPPPLVGPPLYGGNHARQPRIETVPPAPDQQPQWFRELNLDPRHRIVDGLGTRIVQAEQEGLMLGAWNQVIGVEAANRALRLAQLAKHVSASLHQRHLSRLSEAAVVSATERVHAKLLQSPARSIWADVNDSALPPAVTTGAFRRLTRIRGPVAKVAVLAQESRAAAVESLTVRDDHLSADWVLAYANPDGVAGVSASAKDRITDAMVNQIAPGVDRESLFAQWDAALDGPGPEAQLSPDSVEHANVQTLDVSKVLLGSILDRLVRSAPTLREIAEDEERAASGAAHAEFVRSLVQVAAQVNLDRFEVVPEDARRLELAVADDTGDGHRVVVTSDALREWASRVLELARRSFEKLPFPEFENAGEGLRRQLSEGMRIEAGRLSSGLRGIAAKVIQDDPFGDIDRARLDAPGLDLVAKLDPLTTVPARIQARLTSGSGRLPAWLRADWFDDHRIEPAMACPRFHEPMYEPLDRYDREWMVPGLGRIERPDMTTLLATNNRFVEAYLVGLNHEMGRELLWREYPTDQRGTYFSSFWTHDPELVADMHEAPWLTGGVGSHVKAELDGQIVFLVRGDLIRRYPGVVAHAVRQAQDGAVRKTENGIPLFEFAKDEHTPRETLFHIHLPPNILLVGFALTAAEIRQGDFAWWFTLSENPTEPRFGLDESRDPPLLVLPISANERDNLTWDDFNVAEGRFLDATRHPEIVITDRAGETCQWGASSAQVAAVLFQLPARAAFLGTHMLGDH